VAAALPLLLLLCACGSLPKTNTDKTHIAARGTAIAATTKGLARYQGTEFLSFDELKSLVEHPRPEGALGQKLARFFQQPIVSNEAYFSGTRPTRASNDALGEFLRVATWNIEHSRGVMEAARILSSPAAFESRVRAPQGSAEHAELRRQRDRLASADIILLQEMDIGVPRSGYRDAAREMAQALNMNYAYAPQQLEIDPVMLGLEPEPGTKGEMKRPDPARFKGVFGLAVLSRYPIKSAQCFQLRTQPYDWHEGEKARTGPIEAARRRATELAFDNQIRREMKVGGRIFFRVDLDVPGMPGDTVTVIHNHLEIKTPPSGREAQMAEILSHIKDIPHVVIMAGDHNTAQNDLSPTSAARIVKRTSTDPQTWLGVGMKVLMAAPMAVNSGRVAVNTVKNFNSPLAPHVPVVLPNKTRRLFAMVEDFRFEDGGAFDFRGDRLRSINQSSAKLANSNEKAIKGQTPSFSVNRPIGPIGQTRLDWIFVKSLLKHPLERRGPYRLAPHYGEVLRGLSQGLTVRLSDHSPCVVDLPFGEPGLGQGL
jgi:endonuclease/exonuclease/phosphatase family metal-dependent hydrolase